MEDEVSQPTDALAEITAMTEVAKALQPLDSEAVRRVISWASDRFGVAAKANTSDRSGDHEDSEGDDDDYAETYEEVFDDLADLYTRANPRNDPEKSMVVAYWFQKIGGAPDFDSAKLNRELKHMGHGISNITSALSSLIAKRPQLVIQTRKSGSSQQARKKYKLTGEGLKAVEQMLRGEV